jgi:uncharacterized membrane protein YjgN (DUF898 family)
LVLAVASPAARPEPQRHVYTGELGTLYRIGIQNFLLSLVTLGFYRFWGRARLRRYLWNSLVLDGDPFEWTGTGWEMCKSFLVISALALPVYAPAFALSLAGPAYAELLVAYQLLLGLAALLLIGLATFLSLRYRLSRSRWRGIRGDLEGKPGAFAWRSFGWMLAHSMTLFITVPFAAVDLRKWLIERTRLGTLRAHCQARGGAVFLAFLGSAALTLAAFILFWIVLVGSIISAITIAVMADSDTESLGQTLALAFGILFGVLLLAVWPCVSAIYHARLYRHLAETTEAGGFALRTDLRGGMLFRFRLVNLLIAFGTLGIGLPIVWHRRARFLADHLAVVGLERAGLIGQARGTPSRTSEGLLEMLDIGAV